ncbi:MAG: class I SAM-dependent methyltransferase [Candidatus Nitrosocosmicus sp.]
MSLNSKDFGDKNNIKNKTKDNRYKKVVIEIGSGDGRLLNDLADLYNKETVFLIGIETDRKQYIKACSLSEKLNKKNIEFINEPFEKVFLNLDDKSVDTVIAVLPHPDYIDKMHQDRWIPIYKTIYDKIKEKGFFILVTEITDELLQPVSETDYLNWKKWLVETFSSIGFKMFRVMDNRSPLCFSSHYLNTFKNDPQRIKIITLVTIKKD